MPYLSGLLEGFQAAREQRQLQSQEQDAQRRKQEGDLYQYLLQSQDPQIQSLALSGLFESARPGTKAKGLRGFMGEVEGGEIYPQIRSLMDQLVPEKAPNSSPNPPARPGSAALPGTSLVDPGGMPEQALAAEPPPVSPFARVGQEGLPPSNRDLDAAAGQDLAPPANPLATAAGATPAPVSRFKRRGTGVPTAEEIAEASSRAQMRGRIQEITTQLQQAGAAPELIQRAILGIAGAPMPLDSTSAGPMLADPRDPETPIPTVRHRDGTVVRIDGLPLAGLVGWVKPQSQGAGLTAPIRDSPETRQQYGIPPTAVTSSGYWKIKVLPDGTAQWVASEYTPPPAFGGVTTIMDPSSSTGVSTLQISPRGGAAKKVGETPQTSPTQEQAEAVGYLRAVDQEILRVTKPVDGEPPILPLTFRDDIVQKITGGRYLSYPSLVAATQRTKPTAGTPSATSARDRVLDILEGKPPRP